jgi:hypothetical protein
MIWPLPATLVASTSRDRPPRAASQLPMISSVRPTVSARTGLVGIHLGGVPEGHAAVQRQVGLGMALASVLWLPQVIVPRHSSETVRPV